MGEQDVLLWIWIQTVNRRASGILFMLYVEQPAHDTGVIALFLCLSWCIILLDFCICIHTQTLQHCFIFIVITRLFSFQDCNVTNCLFSWRTAWDYLNWRESSRDRVMGQASGLPLADESTQFQCWKRIQWSLCKKETILCHLHSLHAILHGKQDPNSSISGWSVK